MGKVVAIGGGELRQGEKLVEEKFGKLSCIVDSYSGTVLSGLSAGSICWFIFGHSDSIITMKEEKVLMR